MNDTKYKFRWLRVFVGSFFALWIASAVHIRLGPDSIEPEEGEPVSGYAVPQSLSHAILQLDANLDEETKEKVLFYANAEGRELSQYEILESAGYGHLGIGASIRNQWGLWSDSRLKRWFLWRAVIHPDDMSGVVLDEFIEHLRDEDSVPGNLLFQRFAVLAVLGLLVTVIAYIGFVIWRMLRRNNSAIEGTPVEG